VMRPTWHIENSDVGILGMRRVIDHYEGGDQRSAKSVTVQSGKRLPPARGIVALRFGAGARS
jgi:hypothetical protein